jgi:hypothetical protein
LNTKNIQDNINSVSSEIKLGSKEKDTNNKEVVVNLTVPTAIVETIQTKIISAQQKVGSFMSDVARTMYLNYKPPVTAFRINLNPANLGSIAIVMKSNKSNNSMDINMKMSNSSTMDIFTDTKSSLHSAIMRTFNENSSNNTTSNLNLSFDMQGDSSNGGFGESFSQNQQQKQQQDDNDVNSDIASSNEQDIIDNNIVETTDYM